MYVRLPQTMGRLEAELKTLQGLLEVTRGIPLLLEKNVVSFVNIKLLIR